MGGTQVKPQNPPSPRHVLVIFNRGHESSSKEAQNWNFGIGQNYKRDQNKLKMKTILEENRILEFYATEGGTICDKMTSAAHKRADIRVGSFDHFFAKTMSADLVKFSIYDDIQ